LASGKIISRTWVGQSLPGVGSMLHPRVRAGPLSYRDSTIEAVTQAWRPVQVLDGGGSEKEHKRPTQYMLRDENGSESEILRVDSPHEEKS